jgi:hypothetical protein
MAERGDLATVHEPFSRVTFFGSADVGGTTCSSEAEVIAALLRLAASGPVFVKETTDYRYPGVLAAASFLRDASHAMMVRAPEAVVASYLRLHPEASLGAMGFEHLAELSDAVHAATGERPFLLDGDDVAASPAGTVAAYCHAVGLPFLPDALQWEAGALPDWAPFSRWHEKAAASTGLVETTSEPVPDALRERAAAYVAHHAPFYERLRSL